MVTMHRGGNSLQNGTSFQWAGGKVERGMPQHGPAMSVAGWPPGKRLKLAEARWQMAGRKKLMPWGVNQRKYVCIYIYILRSSTHIEYGIEILASLGIPRIELKTRYLEYS